MEELGELLSSKIHEHRHTALLMLVAKFEKSKDPKEKDEIVKFYLKNKKQQKKEKLKRFYQYINIPALHFFMKKKQNLLGALMLIKKTYMYL